MDHLPRDEKADLILKQPLPVRFAPGLQNPDVNLAFLYVDIPLDSFLLAVVGNSEVHICVVVHHHFVKHHRVFVVDDISVCLPWDNRRSVVP
jgi:hypothetical protein